MCRVAFLSLKCDWWVDDYYSANALFHNLGVSFLSTWLRSKGHITIDIDADVLGWDDEDVFRELISFEPQLVAFSELAQNFSRAIALCKHIKTELPGVIILFGDYASSLAPQLLAKQIPGTVDGIIPGDGEAAIDIVCSKLNRKKKIADILKFTTGCAFARQPTTDMITPLHFSSLPIPRRAEPDSSYRAKKTLIVNMISSRGCDHHCSFCTRAQFSGFTQRSWEGRTPDQILEEMDYLSKKFNTTDFFFFDDNFLGPPTDRNYERLLDLCSFIQERRYQFRISCRADSFAGRFDILKALREAGLYRVFVGVESGVESQLTRYKKDVTPQSIKSSIDDFLRFGLAVHIGFIMFDSDAEDSEVLSNIRFLKEIHQGHYFRNYVSCLIVEPGMKQAVSHEIGIALWPDWLHQSFPEIASAFHDICRPIDHWFERIEILRAKGHTINENMALEYEKLKDLSTDMYQVVSRELINEPDQAWERFAPSLQKLRLEVEPTYHCLEEISDERD